MTTAMILGSSGLTGQALLAELIDDNEIEKIILPVRKALDSQNSKVKQQQLDFNQLHEHMALFAVDQVYCCLGTTIKTAGSKAAFKAVDVELVSRCAKLAVKAKAKKFIVISSVGASSKSSNFYSRCKGEMENALTAICQDSATELVICRPSLLLGQRANLRPAEAITGAISKWLTLLFFGPLQKYRPIAAGQLAKAMKYLGKKNSGQHITTLASHELIGLSQIKPQRLS